ncbi:hypothetical protein [Ectothiorhodospira marina]|uniref:Uncharacterized protein n=1 Tax=Ectothiorhodospira marina TaxID=1396821 RepID=A0A1H7JUQ5_9GAMM|nr:hypothetical protein [Ectothiorhodospira marina]SEK78262.1 hypothetical protein SAMN05444515_10536 [Ectothiorhodospira marina]
MNRSMMTLWLIPLLLTVGLTGSGCRHDQGASLPDRTLIVHVQNRTSETIPKVEIGYANVDTQQTTTILQLAPDKTRTITLNHEPGLGYSVEAHLADGNVLEICGGRHPESRVMREVITQESILSGIGKP